MRTAPYCLGTLLVPVLPAVLGLTALVLAQSRDPGASGSGLSVSRPSYGERYGVISERNIFLRERGHRSYRREERPASSERVSTPEDSYVLTGVVIEEGEYRAYIEGSGGSSVIKARVGEPVARGTISRILIDAVEYERGGQRTWIDVGRSFSGAIVTPPSSGDSSSASGSTSQPASGPAALNPNDPNLSLEQRMRLRRMQELNRK